MKKLINKIISMVLVASISVTSMYSSSLKDLVNQSSTSAGTWESPATGSKYYYGGSYKFSFKNTTKFQPWVQVGTPEFKTGCNGVSFKGSFVSILGLDEIKQMLSSAGASLAWGVMIALQYSMPALFAVFNKIREFARAIQKLLQNACQIGTMLASQSTVGKKANAQIESWISSLPGADVITAKNGGLSQIINKIDSFTNCSGMTMGSVEQKKCLSNLTTITKEDTKKLLNPKKGSNGSTIGSIPIIVSGYTPSSTSSNSIKVARLSTVLATGKLDDLQVIPTASKEEAKLTVLLMRVFFGDITLSTKSYEELTKDTNIAALANTGNFKVDQDKVKKRFKLIASGEAQDNSEEVVTYSFKQAVITDPNQIAEALVNGIVGTENTENCSAGKCYIDDAIVFQADLSTKIGTTESDRVIAYGVVDLPASANASPNTLVLEWGGAFAESLSTIKSMVTNKNGTTDTNLSTVSAPLLLPNVSKYIDTIAKIERKAGSVVTPLSAYLKQLLSQYNGYFMATSLVDLMYGKIIDSLATPMGGGSSATELIAYQKSLRETKKLITKALKEKMDENLDYRELALIFKDIDMGMKDEKAKKW